MENLAEPTLLPEGNRCHLHRFNSLVLTMQK
nr:MAG TPA: hypothetical protein [Microviridae sp.]